MIKTGNLLEWLHVSPISRRLHAALLRDDQLCDFVTGFANLLSFANKSISDIWKIQSLSPKEATAHLSGATVITPFALSNLPWNCVNFWMLSHGLTRIQRWNRAVIVAYDTRHFPVPVFEQP